MKQKSVKRIYYHQQGGHNGLYYAAIGDSIAHEKQMVAVKETAEALGYKAVGSKALTQYRRARVPKVRTGKIVAYLIPIRGGFKKKH